MNIGLCLRAVVIQISCGLSSVAIADAKNPPCPDLDLNGKPHALALPPHPDVTTKEQDKAGVPDAYADLALQAASIIGRYESSTDDPWSNVSGQEVLSVGFMQWNWITDSLRTTFLARVADSEIQAAPAAIRPGLIVLKASANSSTPTAAARAVIAQWGTAATGDPIVASRQRRSVDLAWREWLVRPAVKAVQVELLDSQLRLSYSLARKWTDDEGRNEDHVDLRTLASFFDLVTFNGGRAQLWLEHVRAYKAAFKSNAETIGAVADWLASCSNFVSPDQTEPNRRMYGRSDALISASMWRKALAENPASFTDAQVDLLVFGFLRARRSVGDDKPQAFPGVYQADVLNRRGAIALGIGQVHGSKQTVDPFR